MKYYVDIDITSNYTVEVEAANIDDAVSIARKEDIPSNLPPNDVAVICVTDENGNENWDL